MKKSIMLFTALACVALGGAMVWAAEQKSRPEAAVLPAAAYRTPLQEIIVEGRAPYWQREAPPRWDKPKVDAPKPGEATPGRLQWMPPYTREERDDYVTPRDPLNPQPRTRIFELKF